MWGWWLRRRRQRLEVNVGTGVSGWVWLVPSRTAREQRRPAMELEKAWSESYRAH